MSDKQLLSSGETLTRFADKPKSQSTGKWIALAESVIDSYADKCEKLNAQVAEQENRLSAFKFWSECYPEGMTLDNVKNELSDYHHLLDGMAELLSHITGGECSKPLTNKDVIKALHDDYVTSLCNENSEEFEARITELEQQLAAMQPHALKEKLRSAEARITELEQQLADTKAKLDSEKSEC